MSTIELCYCSIPGHRKYFSEATYFACIVICVGSSQATKKMGSPVHISSGILWLQIEEPSDIVWSHNKSAVQFLGVSMDLKFQPLFKFSKRDKDIEFQANRC